MAANNDVKENEITQASAQATLANLKEIRVVTMDGSSKAYGKADFMAVIAAGIKSYFSSIAAGNIAGILTADSGKAGISALADVAQVLGVPYTINNSNTWLEPGKALRLTTGCTRLSALVITRFSCYVFLLYINAGVVQMQNSLKTKISGADMGFYYVTNGNSCDIYITTSTNTDCIVLPFWRLPEGAFEMSVVNALPSGAVAF